MEYEELQPIRREELLRILRRESSEEVEEALIRAALHDPEWRWVQGLCLDLLKRGDHVVRAGAIVALGHLARLHRTLDLELVLPALAEARQDPELVGRIEDALDDIGVFVAKH